MVAKNSEVVLVTGATGLLGRAVCRTLLDGGTPVIASDINLQGLEEMKQSLGSSPAGMFRVVPLDVSREEDIRALLTRLDEDQVPISGLVNCAYPRNKNYGAKLENVGYADFCENVSLHLGAYFLICKEFALHCRQRKQGASVVNISSIYGVVAPRFEIYQDTAMTMPVEYAAIKAGLINITKYFSRYFKGSGVRFNCVSPGGLKANQPESFLCRYNEYGLSKGMLDVEDVTGAIAYLLSDAAKYVNGQNLIVDDGWSL